MMGCVSSIVLSATVKCDLKNWLQITSLCCRFSAVYLTAGFGGVFFWFLGFLEGFLFVCFFNCFV